MKKVFLMAAVAVASLASASAYAAAGTKDIKVYSCAPATKFNVGMQFVGIDIFASLALTNEVQMNVKTQKVVGGRGTMGLKLLKPVLELDAIQAGPNDVRRAGLSVRDVQAMYTSVDGNYRVLISREEVVSDASERIAFKATVNIGTGMAQNYECDYISK